MGTRFEVLINSSSHALARLAVHAARTEIERLNRVFNDRRGDSEISELNRTHRIEASAELFAVLHLSEMWRHVSHGAFDGRIGRLLKLWATNVEPNHGAIARMLSELRNSTMTLDSIRRSVELSSNVVLSLDAIAKGYIVDAALNAACRAAPSIEGLAISIGGDIRCWGKSHDTRGWHIGIPDPIHAAENAPLIDVVALSNAAIATSGRGPRDCTGEKYRSTTISPFTGYPKRDVISASVIASHAADADAIATACMVMSPNESIAMVNQLDRVAARITDAQGLVHKSSRWPTTQLAASETVSNKAAPNKTKQSAEGFSARDKNPLPPQQRWPADWEIGITYTEPKDKEKQTSDFRDPYIAIWITDTQNNPVNTVFMLGTAAKWHRDNFIWWGSHTERAEHMVELRSQSTTLSGRYQTYWGGVDDDWKPVPIGKYILHLETSQEHGKHSHRSVTLDVGRERFKMSLPNLIDSGGIEITYGHYNDRFKSDD
ncbi:MAG TPA: DUF2271 domain-containing protein [Steroidobacteraceae bacterium]|nr:DUF2271 domain-containing protein [Steroidobacteraceae bacterium]